MKEEECYPVIEEVDMINNKKQQKGYSCWIVDPNRTFIPSEPIITIDKLNPGRYKIKWNNEYNRYSFVEVDSNSDELLDLPSDTFSQILSDIDFFWNNKKSFDKYKYVHKRGILLYGTPGCGKSSICTLLSNQIVEKNGIVLNVNNSESLRSYSETITSIFRFIEPDTKILTIFEDLDGLVKDSETETLLLNILDGNNQLNNVVNIGCTNYPEKLKERILNRPSRFDRRYNIGLPNSEIRKFYFKNKIDSVDFSDKILDMVVLKTEGLTLAHLGEFIKSVFIFNKDMDETIALLKGMGDFISSTKDKNSNLGFNKK